MSHPSLQSRVTRRDCAEHHGWTRAGDPTMLTMHASESNDDAAGTMHYLNTTIEKKASYHYLIDRDGAITRMCDPAIVAYHSGDSAWPAPKRATEDNQKPNGGKSVNGVSIGICWANNARNTGEQLTDAQLESALWLCATLMTQYGIPVERVRSHSEVSPGRKVDPDAAMMPEHFRQLLRDYLEAA